MSKKNLEHFINVVEGGQTKTASAKRVAPSLLEKLANELMAEGAEGSAPAAPTPTTTNSVQVVPAAGTGVGASPEVVAATDAVTAAQLAAAGMTPGQHEQGEIPAQAVAAPILVGAQDGNMVGAADGKTQEAAAAAASPVSTTPSEIKTAADAEALGRTMARSFHGELQKLAQDNEYIQSLELLKQAGVLDGYKLADEDRLTKTASSNQEFPALEKIAAMQDTITKTDIIQGAQEYLRFAKLAEEAEEAGRAEAQEMVDEVAGEELAAAQQVAAAEQAAEEADVGISEEQLADIVAELKSAGYSIVKNG